MFRSLVFVMTLVAGSVFASESVLVESEPITTDAAEAVIVSRTRVREVKRSVIIPTVPVFVGTACEPIATACEPVVPACEPIKVCCPVIVVKPAIKVERTVHVERTRNCVKRTVEKQYKLMSGCPCDPCYD